MPSDEYLIALQDKLITIEQEIFDLVDDIKMYLGSPRNEEDVDHLIRSLRDVQEEMIGNWPVDTNAPKAGDIIMKASPDLNVGLSANELMGKRGEPMQEPEEARFNSGPHAILITPGCINALPPFRVKVWLNADKGNTSHNPKFLEIKSSKEFKTRGAAYEYGSHLCRRANTRSS